MKDFTSVVTHWELTSNTDIQVSLALATGVVLKALHQRANFYAACVYLSQSSANLMVSMHCPENIYILLNGVCEY